MDIDLITYSRFNPMTRDFWGDLGYKPNESVIRYFGRYRHIYQNDEKQLYVDIFFDRLSFCHSIDFRGGLKLDSPTSTVTDMLLEKMQIVEINEKDLKDSIILLRQHEVGGVGVETIDGNYIAKLLANDWGFNYTVLTKYVCT